MQSCLLQEIKMLDVILVIVGLITAVSSCPDCCTTYIHLTDTSSLTPSGCSRSCNITINELSATQHSYDLEWYKHRVASCSKREFVFQSGTHHVHYSQSPLSFISIGSVIIRGEPNATIKCWNTALSPDIFSFVSVPNVTIKDMHIWNCNCQYHFLGYMFNGTDHHKVNNLLIEILNSNFINSRFIYDNPAVRPKSMSTKIIIKDTIVQNYTKSFQIHSFLVINRVYYYNKISNDNRNFCKLFNITIQAENVNFMDNSVPFIAHTYIASLCVFITFTGCNNFAQNEGTIISIPPACNLFQVSIQTHRTSTQSRTLWRCLKGGEG